MPATVHYIDTSALAKRYVPERGSGWIAALLRNDAAAISGLSDAEMASLLARRVRESVIPSAQANTIYQAYLRDREQYRTVELTPDIARSAADLLLSTPLTITLRTLDAIHVVSAQRAFAEAQRYGFPTGNFITADRNLLAAAAWAGFTVVNPEDFP